MESNSLAPLGLLDEVRDFLGGLRRELPSLFPQARADSRERAREIFGARVAHWVPRMGLEGRVRRISIKDQRTLWGSCTRGGNLNFNWRVVLAPPAVLDYLVIHELANLHEMNHSKRFWGRVAEHCPDYKAHRKWLRSFSRMRP